jgi:hypothetical protein
MSHGLRVVARDVQRHPTILKLKMLGLGVDSPGQRCCGQGIDNTERNREVSEALISNADPSDRDARETILAIFRVQLRILGKRLGLHESWCRKTLFGRGARSATPRLLGRLITRARQLPRRFRNAAGLDARWDAGRRANDRLGSGHRRRLVRETTRRLKNTTFDRVRRYWPRWR